LYPQASDILCGVGMGADLRLLVLRACVLGGWVQMLEAQKADEESVTESEEFHL
jgi:hypothetical protein